MSKLYKSATLLVSRAYYHGGEGLENEGLRFFRSRQEYDAEAKRYGWNEGKSFKSSWCTPPVEIEALVGQKDLARFKEGNRPLTVDKVFFAAGLISKVNRIGGWQG